MLVGGNPLDSKPCHIVNGLFESRNADEIIIRQSRTISVALVGNPNSGKTSLFNAISGGREHVGNYSGVTVDAKEGTFQQNGYTFRIVDLPGTYSPIRLHAGRIIRA